jgi:hypothetical protein
MHLMSKKSSMISGLSINMKEMFIKSQTQIKGILNMAWGYKTFSLSIIEEGSIIQSGKIILQHQKEATVITLRNPFFKKLKKLNTKTGIKCKFTGTKNIRSF